MKRATIKDKSGEKLEFFTPESYIYDSTKRILQDKIISYNDKITSINTSIANINTRISRLKISAKDLNPFNGVKLRATPDINICLLTDKNGTITSDYGYTYDKLSGILESGLYKNYIKDGDYMLITGSDGKQYTMYVNLDTYYGLGTVPIGHHIDFISKELIYGSYGWIMKPSTSNNNGVAAEQSPFLSASSTYGATNGIINKLNTYFNILPSGLRNHIVPKYHNVPYRYSATGIVAYDTGSAWKNMGKLWLPYEREVLGTNTNASASYEKNMIQYFAFKSITDFRKKLEYGSTTNILSWWTASPHSISTNSYVTIINTGLSSYTTLSSTTVAAPLCFRFQ